MPANAKPAKYPSRLYNIVLRITGKEKNRILKEANKQNLSLSEYIKYAVWVTMRNEQGIPPPTTTKIELKCDMVVESFGVMRVCATCNLRLD
jgi:hypothetical protein